MTKHPTFPAPRMNRVPITDNATHTYDLDEYLGRLCQLDDPRFLDDPGFVDEPEFAEGYGLPINSLTEDDLRFLRDFILSSAMYVEQLEAFLCDSSDDFWQAREQAYRIITALLIRHYEYELEV